AALGDLVGQFFLAAGRVHGIGRAGDDDRLVADLRIVAYTDRRRGGQVRSVRAFNLAVRAGSGGERVDLPLDLGVPRGRALAEHREYRRFHRRDVGNVVREVFTDTHLTVG